MLNRPIFIIIDVRENSWRDGASLEHADLETLSSQVPGILFHARAENTTKSYHAAFSKWIDWAAAYPEIKVLPAQPVHIVLYLTHLAHSVKSFSSISQFTCAVSWMHSTHGFNSPIKTPIVAEVINGLKRLLAGPVSPKEPFTPNDIKRIFTDTNKSSLTELRNTAMITIAYFAFLRVDELLHIKLNDLTVFKDHLQINIPKAKTDQLRQGTTVVIAKGTNDQCPVELLMLYVKTAKIALKGADNNYLFCRIIFKKGKLSLFEPSKCMSYSNVRDIVKSTAEKLGLDPRQYATHSMRSGGATAAAGAGVSERVMQKHGRWACATSKDRYVKDDIEKRLKISQKLME